MADDLVRPGQLPEIPRRIVNSYLEGTPHRDPNSIAIPINFFNGKCPAGIQFGGGGGGTNSVGGAGCDGYALIQWVA